MLKTVRVPPELLALSQLQRAATRELGAPLFLPAFQSQVLEAGWDDPDAEIAADTGVEAEGFDADEDDDFY